MKEQSKELSLLVRDYNVSDDKANFWFRRFFRCWLDGSYNGEAIYRRNMETYKAMKTDCKRISFAKNQFILFLSAEFSEISVSTICKIFKDGFTTEELKEFNSELMEDCNSIYIDRYAE